MSRHFVAGAIFLLLFTALGFSVQANLFPGDSLIARVLVGHQSDLLRLVSVMASLPVWTPLVLLTAATLLSQGNRRAGLAVVLADLSAEALSFLAKMLVNRARPSNVRLEDLVATASFPSGHTVRATVALGVLAVLLLGPRSRAQIVGVVAIVVYLLTLGVARIASGEHWFSDILGGYLLGAAGIELTLAVTTWRGRRERLPKVGDATLNGGQTTPASSRQRHG